MRYGPSGSRIARNRPAVSVVSVFSKFVSVLRIATDAPGSAASVWSTTVPEMTPVVAWVWESPEAGRSARSEAHASAARHQDFAISTSLLRDRSGSSDLFGGI